MKEIIGVRFRPNGKIYYFDPQNFEVEAGSFVIVETARGVEYGKVVLGRRVRGDPRGQARRRGSRGLSARHPFPPPRLAE